MKRPTLYSRSPAMTAARAAPADAAAPDAARRARSAAGAEAAAPAAAPGTRRWRWRPAPRTARALLVATTALCAAAAALLGQRLLAPPPVPTQRDIDRAVLHTLATKALPSAQARAVERVAASVVRVRSAAAEVADDGKAVEGTGTGVVIVDDGTILTNLHVVRAAGSLTVEFADGTVSEAAIVRLLPEQDLAVLRARLLPDDLQPATLRSTADLRPGDQVVAVGFPFGIGPSASAGIVSGLRREFRSADGARVLGNLIQFDAAANPGNSGGPLVTLDGEVVGIVTAILNPGQQRVFIGIGFAVPIENAAAGAGVHPF